MSHRDNAAGLSQAPLLLHSVTTLSSQPKGTAPDWQVLSNEEKCKIWSQLQVDIKASILNLPDELDVFVLDAAGKDWVTAHIRFSEGKMSLEHGTLGAFACVTLSGVAVAAHIYLPYIQVIGLSQSFLLRFSSHEDFVRCFSAIYAWSKARPAGIESKRWIPPISSLDHPKEDLLVCEMTVHFTALSPHGARWSRAIGCLKRSGLLVLNEGHKKLLSLDITRIRSSCIRRVDYSLVSSEFVIFIVPDMGGPESVYLKLSCDDDFEDWFVSLRGFAQHEVFASQRFTAATSLRYNYYLKIGLGSVRIDSSSSSVDLSNIYADITVDDWMWARTAVSNNSEAPSWDQEFCFTDLETAVNGFEIALRRAEDIRRPNELDAQLGHIHVSTSQDIDHWIPFEKSPFFLSVYLSLEYVSIPVINAPYYKNIRSQIMDFNLMLPLRLVQAIPSCINNLCPVFFDLYRSECKQTYYILKLISAEVDNMVSEGSSVLSSNVIFRGSSLLTRTLERYLQAGGHDVLCRTIGRFARKIIVANESFELDPMRLEDGKSVESNAAALNQFMEYLWHLIKGEPLPESFRCVFTHLRKELTEKLNAEPSQIANAISAFLFLRFYCPALLSPRKFKLIDTTTTTANQRALMLSAKILQGFASRTRFGSKESWLIPMNNFIDAYDKELLKFYNGITNFKGDPRSVDRIPKELAVSPFMFNNLSNPYLIDVCACYSRLIHIVSSLTMDDSISSDVKFFQLECRNVLILQKEIIADLEKPDDVKASQACPENLDLTINWYTSLFGTDKVLLEPPDIHPDGKKQGLHIDRKMRRFFRGHS